MEEEIYEAAENAARNMMLKLLCETDWFIAVNWVSLPDYDNIAHLLSDIEQPYTSVELLAELHTSCSTVEEIARVAVVIENEPCDKVIFVRAAGYVYNFYGIKL